MLSLIIQKTSHYLDCTFHSLKNRNFRYFWTGQCISLIGTFMQRAALYYLFYILTDSPFMLGMLGVCQFLPLLLFSLFAGPLIERLPRKKLIIITQIIFLLQAAVLSLLTFTGLVQYWHLLILMAVFGITMTFDIPARQTFLYDMVGKEDIMNAVSLNSTIVNVAKIIGPAAAGIFLLHFGAAFCFLINAISYVAVLISLIMIKVETANQKREARHITKEIFDGFRYIKRSQIMMIAILIFGIVSTFAMNNDVIAPVFSKSVFGGGAAEYSALLTAAGIGSFIGALFMASRSKYGINKNLLILGAVLTAVFQVSTVLTANNIVCLILLAGTGFANIVLLNTANAIFQLNSSDEYRTRVMSIYSLLLQGSTPLGNFFAGTVMDNLGGASGFLICGLITLIMLAPVFIIKRRTISCWLNKNEKYSDKNINVK